MGNVGARLEGDPKTNIMTPPPSFTPPQVVRVVSSTLDNPKEIVEDELTFDGLKSRFIIISRKLDEISTSRFSMLYDLKKNFLVIVERIFNGLSTEAQIEELEAHQKQNLFQDLDLLFSAFEQLFTEAQIINNTLSTIQESLVREIGITDVDSYFLNEFESQLISILGQRILSVDYYSIGESILKNITKGLVAEFIELVVNNAVLNVESGLSENDIEEKIYNILSNSDLDDTFKEILQDIAKKLLSRLSLNLKNKVQDLRNYKGQLENPDYREIYNFKYKTLSVDKLENALNSIEINLDPNLIKSKEQMLQLISNINVGIQNRQYNSVKSDLNQIITTLNSVDGLLSRENKLSIIGNLNNFINEVSANIDKYKSKIEVIRNIQNILTSDEVIKGLQNYIPNYNVLLKHIDDIVSINDKASFNEIDTILANLLTHVELFINSLDTFVADKSKSAANGVFEKIKEKSGKFIKFLVKKVTRGSSEKSELAKIEPTTYRSQSVKDNINPLLNEIDFYLDKLLIYLQEINRVNGIYPIGQGSQDTLKNQQDIQNTIDSAEVKYKVIHDYITENIVPLNFDVSENEIPEIQEKITLIEKLIETINTYKDIPKKFDLIFYKLEVLKSILTKVLSIRKTNDFLVRILNDKPLDSQEYKLLTDKIVLLKVKIVKNLESL